MATAAAPSHRNPPAQVRKRGSYRLRQQRGLWRGASARQEKGL